MAFWTWEKRRLGVWLAIAAGGLLGLYPMRVRSQPIAPGSIASVGSERRIVELEARVAKLEARIKQLESEQASATVAGSMPSAQASVAPVSVRAFPLPGDLSSEAASGHCASPYVMDRDGFRAIREGCEDSAVGPCDPPYVVDADYGLRTLRPGCTEASPRRDRCAIPYYVDPSGRRVMRRECLDVGY